MTKLFIVFIYFPVPKTSVGPNWTSCRAVVCLRAPLWATLPKILQTGPFFLSALSHVLGDLDPKTIFFQLWLYILELRVVLWWYRWLWCCRTCRTGQGCAEIWYHILYQPETGPCYFPEGLPVHQCSPPYTHTGQAFVIVVDICVVFRVGCQTRW